MDPEYSNKPVVIMENVNERLFKHNSEVVKIQTNIEKHDHNSWFPKGYTKYRTVPRESMYIFGEYGPIYKDRKSNKNIQLAYDFKIPYLEFVDDMLNFRIITARITKLDKNGEQISDIYYNLYEKSLKVDYYNDKVKWVDGEFKGKKIDVRYVSQYKVS